MRRSPPAGAIKSVGHSHMECCGKRSATPLWLVFVPYPSQEEPLKPKRRRASLAAALLKSRSTPDSFKRLPSHTVQSPCDRAPVTNGFSPSRFQWHTLPERMDLSATRERVLATEEILHDGRDCLLQMAKVQF